MAHTMSPSKVITAPSRQPINSPAVILLGSITTPSWRTALCISLQDLPITILDPSRDDWDSSWIESPSFEPFREQVEWELEHARAATIVAIYFDPKTQAPVSLMELGMWGTIKGENVVVCCPEGFWKRGYVQMVSKSLGVKFCETPMELEKTVREKMLQLI